MLWTRRSIAATPEAAWDLLTDLDRWPVWGPSVRAATLDDPEAGFVAGATGTVTTALGPSVPFELTAVTPGRAWSWRVARIPATSHEVVPAEIGCQIGFGVPAWAPPYLLVCRLALQRIDRELRSG